jgi:hypothetical protein
MVWVDFAVQVGAYVAAAVAVAAVVHATMGRHALAVGTLVAVTAVAVGILIPKYRDAVRRSDALRETYAGLTEESARGKCVADQGAEAELPFIAWVEQHVPDDALFVVEGGPLDLACLTYQWLPRRPAVGSEAERAWRVSFADERPAEAETDPSRVERFAAGRWLVRPPEGTQ